MATVSRLIVAVAFALSVAGGVAAATHDDGATQQGAAIGGVVPRMPGAIGPGPNEATRPAPNAPLGEQITARIVEAVNGEGIAGASEGGVPAYDFMADPEPATVAGVLAGVEVATGDSPDPTTPRATHETPEPTEATEEPAPAVTDPPETEPPWSEPPDTEPPVTDPPHTEPEPTDPPWTEPDPEPTDPPWTEPPASDPPETGPPATEPEPETTQPSEEPADEPDTLPDHQVPDVPTEGE